MTQAGVHPPVAGLKWEKWTFRGGPPAEMEGYREYVFTSGESPCRKNPLLPLPGPRSDCPIVFLSRSQSGSFFDRVGIYFWKKVFSK